jgi:hypothetical protein
MYIQVDLLRVRFGNNMMPARVRRLFAAETEHMHVGVGGVHEFFLTTCLSVSGQCVGLEHLVMTVTNKQTNS